MSEYAPPASSSGYISPAEIRKMKKNMQKVPLIQQKSDAFHQKELLEAEIAFEQAQENIIDNKSKVIIEEKILTGEQQIPQKRRKARWKKVIRIWIKKKDKHI